MNMADVIVVGAGAFGGWSALSLLRKGKRVLLLDAWGPGNSRASSGGETRIIRATYGPKSIYTDMAVRSLQLWQENEQRWKRTLYHHTGFLWMVGTDGSFEQAALPILRNSGVAFEELSPAELIRRFPQINPDGVKWAIYEKDGGYLTARLACQTVLEEFISEGGEYQQLAVNTPRSAARS